MLSRAALSVYTLVAIAAATDPSLDLRTCFLNPDYFVSGSQNASDSIEIKPPLNPLNGSQLNLTSNWTWNIAVESYKASYVSTGVWLETSPPQDLAAVDLNFLACGLVLEGLNTASEDSGQHDDGSCSNVISQKCRSAIDETIRSKYPSEIPTASDSGGAWNMCAAWQNLATSGGVGLPDECSGNFTKSNVIETFAIASPQFHGNKCWSNGQVGNETSPLFFFNGQQYSQNNLTAYDAQAMYTTPLVTVAFANISAGEQPWIDTRFTCLTPRNFAEGSRRPTSVPQVGEGGRIERQPTSLSLLTLSVVLLLLP